MRRHPFSIDVREYLRESNAIENVHSEDALKTSLSAWEYLKDKPELTHETVKQSHKLLLEDRQPEIAGEYRNVMVRVGRDIPPAPKEIKPLMEDLLERPRPTDGVEAIRFHVDFEKIHPFEDGNGRIGRIIYLWHCHQLGIDPIIWRESDINGYYSLFR